MRLTERFSRATVLANMGEVLQSCVSQEEILKAAVGFARKIFSSCGALRCSSNAIIWRTELMVHLPCTFPHI